MNKVEKIDGKQAIILQEKIIEILKTIYDPEIPVNIYELGLIYEVTVTPFKDVYVRMTLTSPNCPVAGSLPGDVQSSIESIPEVKDVEVELTFDPPWSMDLLSEEAKLELGML